LNKCRINIAIVEPSHIIYEGLSNILLQSDYHYQIYRFESYKEVFEELSGNNIDVAIINPDLIKNNISEFVQKKNSNNSVPWIGILYSFYERELLYLFDITIQITDSSDEITCIINKLLSSNYFCTNSTQTGQLTGRELDILKQITQGLSNKEIADKLNISTHTVISHRKNIVHKTGIKSQAGLTIYAISNNIINLDHISF